MLNRITSISITLLFFLAVLTFGMAMLDRLLFVSGYALFWLPFSAIRLLETSAILLLFVITLVLFQIRDGLRK